MVFSKPLFGGSVAVAMLFTSKGGGPQNITVDFTKVCEGVMV